MHVEVLRLAPDTTDIGSPYLPCEGDSNVPPPPTHRDVHGFFYVVPFATAGSGPGLHRLGQYWQHGSPFPPPNRENMCSIWLRVTDVCFGSVAVPECVPWPLGRGTGPEASSEDLDPTTSLGKGCAHDLAVCFSRRGRWGGGMGGQGRGCTRTCSLLFRMRAG